MNFEKEHRSDIEQDSQEVLPDSSIEKKKEGKISRFIKATALALALTFVDQNPADAIELAPKASWSNAITENIRESVDRDKVETRFTYVKYSHDGEWLQVNSGQKTQIDINLNKLSREIISNPRYEEMERICFGHSHPAEVLRSATPGSDLYKKLSNPPSDIPGDIQTAGIMKDELAKVRIDGNKLIYFVADVNGVWYFRKAMESDYHGDLEKTATKQISTKSAKVKFDEVRTAFIQKSSETEDDLRETSEYHELVNSYRLDRGGMVRFVPYKDVSSEPPCAGVDFIPSK